jgi:hypothetical protein
MIEKMKAIALREHTPQPAVGVFDRVLNAKDLQSVYPGRDGSGDDPSAGKR